MANITIFEGPDGSGKTTAAKKYANLTGALYFHMGDYPNVSNLKRIYMEAMAPALLGLRDVVLDRCWYSEPIYNGVFHHRENRITPMEELELELLARRCKTAVVYCDPGLKNVKNNFNARIEDEMLNSIDQLEDVYNEYMDKLWLRNSSILKTIKYEYTQPELYRLDTLLDIARIHVDYPETPSNVKSIGRYGAEYVYILPSKPVSAIGDSDSYLQWTSWFALCEEYYNYLISTGIPPFKMMFVDENQDLRFLKEFRNSKFYVAYERTYKLLNLMGLQAKFIDIEGVNNGITQNN